MKRVLAPTAAFVLAAFLVPTGAQAVPPTFDQAIDQLFAQGYPQDAEDFLLSLGTNPELGFRWAGTSADNAAAEFLAGELEAMGLEDVRLEPVPVDVFEFRSAGVVVGDREIVASAFAGVRPTPPEGLTGEVVYVHDGTAADFDAYGPDFDWTGKLALVDGALDSWWMNLPGAEATYRGAAGVILTKGPHSTDWYTYRRDALGSNDAEYDMSFVPMVYVSWKDGAWLKRQLAGDSVTATMTLDADVTLADDGGVGYNVVGEIPGIEDDGTFTLFASHHDAHFRDAHDDTGAVVTELAIAKAMMASGYRPSHTVTFLFTTAEEFGYTNSWYDWSIGAWYAINHEHPEWAGQIRAFVNMEGMAGGAPLTIATTPELAPWMDRVGVAEADVLTQGYHVVVPQSTWQDGWTFTAAGVPTVYVAEPGTPDGTYHTQYHTTDVLDWPHMANIAKFLERVQGRLDGGLLPYRLGARADEVAGAVDADALVSAGADAVTVDRLATAIRRFGRAAAAYRERAGDIAADDQAAANATLLEIEKLINGNLTALSAWDWMAYPHEQVQNDVECLQAAIAALQDGRPAGALKELTDVALTWYGLQFSHDVYTADLERRDPSHPRVTWGAQGHPIEYLDVIPQYRAIEAGTWDAGTVAELRRMRNRDLADLDARLLAMARVLEEAASLIRTVG